MNVIVRTRLFERSYRKLNRSGMFKAQARDRLETAITSLAGGRRLPPQFRDHQLEGEFKPYRECHIGGDLVLVYRIDPGAGRLFLVDVGDHAHVFGE
jgi:mRNA interferase YafQ